MNRVAGIYVRISDDREGAGLGVQRQLEDCAQLAKSVGWAIGPDRIYVDNDLTAYAPSGKLPVRPEYQRLVQDIRAGQLMGVLCWHTDRLHRTPMELEHYIVAADERDVELRSVRSGSVDLSTPTGRAVARTMCAWARQESEHKSDRLTRKHRELAEAGKNHGGGTRPFGFEPDRRTIRESEAIEIRRMFDHLLAGWSLRAIVTDLQNRSVATVTGTEWKNIVVRRLMLGGRVAGLREYQRKKHGAGTNILGEAEWPAIVPRESWEAVRAVLMDPSRSLRSHPRRYLASGIAKCGMAGCGKALVSRPTLQRSPSMVCASGAPHYGCGKIRVQATGLEEMVTEYTLRRLSNPAFLDSVVGSVVDASPLLADIERDEQRLSSLAAVFADSIDDDPMEYRMAATRIQGRIEANRKRMRQVQVRCVAVAVNPTTVRADWKTFDISHQRALIELAIQSVVVGPALTIGLNRFDPRRVIIERRAAR